jgi:hypothetical protein
VSYLPGEANPDKRRYRVYLYYTAKNIKVYMFHKARQPDKQSRVVQKYIGKYKFFSIHEQDLGKEISIYYYYLQIF